MSIPKKKKRLNIILKPNVLDRMDLIHMVTDDPSTFSEQETALWDALDDWIDAEENDTLGVSAVNTPFADVMTAMNAI